MQKSIQFFTSGVAQISLCGGCMSHWNISRWNKLTFRLDFHFFPSFSSVLNDGTLIIPLFLVFVRSSTAPRYWCSLSKIVLQHFQSHVSSSLPLLVSLYVPVVPGPSAVQGSPCSSTSACDPAKPMCWDWDPFCWDLWSADTSLGVPPVPSAHRLFCGLTDSLGPCRQPQALNYVLLRPPASFTASGESMVKF